MDFIQWFYDYLESFFLDLNINQIAVGYIVDVIIFLCAILLSILAYFVIKILVLGITKLFTRKSKKTWAKEIITSAFFLKLFKILPAFIIYKYLTAYMISIKIFVDLVLLIYITFVGLSALFLLIDLINSFYNRYYKQAKTKPIKGILSIVKLIVFFVVLIIVIARIIGQSPTYLLTGLGALSAVLLLIFKDSLLGFVAGFQMSANDLVGIGDWIEMPKYNADGFVIDISLSFVKVRNFDQTIVTIPAYALVSESFINWRGMFNQGGRRIKRSISIDASSVRFYSKEELERLKKVELISKYVTEKQKEINLDNKKRGINKRVPINGRAMTNLGTFRVYLLEYLKNNPNIRQDMLLTVRQLQTENKGVPLEIYAFSKKTVFAEYEVVLADIFDHIYASIDYFGLKIFQEPSGHDLLKLKKSVKKD